MLKKICKQREKIEKLAARENDAAEKLEQLRQELAGERDALDEMEKEHLFSLMRERELSLEETIALMEQGAEVMPEDTEESNGDVAEMEGVALEEVTNPVEPEESADETEAVFENIFTEELAADFIEKQDKDTSDTEAADHGGFWRR